MGQRLSALESMKMTEDKTTSGKQELDSFYTALLRGNMEEAVVAFGQFGAVASFTLDASDE